MTSSRHATKRRTLMVMAVMFGLLSSSGATALASPGPAQHGRPAVPAAAAEAGQVSCDRHVVPVSLTAGGPKSMFISGVLCATPAELTNGTTIQLLVPGGTYNHIYWDFGTVNGTDYSYAPALAAAGIPTFDIDPLGTGESSRPLSALLTIETAGFAIHQVVQALLGASGASVRPGVPDFGKVILVGHSLGSLAAWSEAIHYQDISGLIITGMIHHLSTKTIVTLGTAFYPALLDPKFAGTIIDPGYVTTFPGNRGNTFYNQSYADPAVIAKDEASKDMMSLAELDGFIPSIDDATRAINVPTLVIMGSDDLLCPPGPLGSVPGLLGGYDCSTGSAIAAQEAPAYGPGAHVQACSIANSGHDIALSYGYALEEAAAADWSMATVGQQGVRTNTPLPTACGFDANSARS